MDIVTVSNLHKSFTTRGHTVNALKGISFTVQQGEVFAFLGPNGSGKTTSLHILARLLEPDDGSVRIFGKAPHDATYFEHVSFLSGDSEFAWELSGHDILQFYRKILRVEQVHLEVLIDRFAMRSKLGQSWMEYSNGEKTRLRLIKALMKQPKMLFLDEPTVGLDPEVSLELRLLLKDLSQQGMTILLTTHYMRDVEALADRICFIKEGIILETVPREGLGTDLEAYFISLFGKSS